MHCAKGRILVHSLKHQGYQRGIAVFARSRYQSALFRGAIDCQKLTCRNAQRASQVERVFCMN
jgi:hypothetical protein